MPFTNVRTVWPTTWWGQVSVAFGAAFAAMFLWVIFLDPVVRLVTGRDTAGLTDTWVTPLAMVALVDAAAVTAIVAWRHGERAVLGQAVLWGSVALAVLWTGVIVGSLLTNA